MREAFKKNITNIINKRRLSLRYSITENQEENNRSMNDSKLGKNIMTDNNSNKNFLINPKDGKETTISKKSNKQKFLKKISSKSFHKSNWDKDSSTEENNKKYLKYQSIKRRISEQQNRKENLIIKKFQIHDQKKDLSLSNKKKKVYFQMSNQNNIKNTKKSQKFLGFKNKLFTYFRKSSMTNKIILRNKSFNLSCTGSSIVQFHSTKTIRKDSFFGNRRINMNGEDDKILQINLFEKLKNNPMFEKSEKIIKKEKILYGLLALCTLLNIFFQILEAIQYNKKSLIYLENYASNNTVPNKPKKKRPKFYEKEILYYNIIQKREISSEENTLRIFNIIFSIMCIILVLNIYYIKNQYVKQANKNKKNFFRYSCNQFRFNKRIKDHDHIRITSINDDFIPTKKVSKNELIITIISCFINLIFYPPGLNKVLIRNNKNVINVYSLNSIFLVFTFLKLINIYRAIIHLSPLNSLVYKTICNSKMIKMDFLFMLRYFLNRYPLFFISCSFLLLGLIFCILIFCVEFFSIDTVNGIWNNKGDNNLKNFYNCLHLYFFYIIKNNFGNIKPKSILGTFILIIGGTFGMLILLYFMFYTNELLGFTPQELKAYKKLNKILDPLNNQHKSANLIKILFLLKKMLKNYRNVEINYKITKMKKIKNLYKSFHKLKSNFDFAPTEDTSLMSAFENDMYDERKKYIYYLGLKFIFKLKLLTECKIFKNNLSVARNFSYSFTDVLKNLGHKMDDNLTQLNQKLHILSEYEDKYKKFELFHRRISRKIKKLLKNNDVIINYLIDKNNTNIHSDHLFKQKKKKKKGKIKGSLIDIPLSLHKKLVKKKIDYQLLNYSSPRKINLNRIISSEMAFDFKNMLSGKKSNDIKPDNLHKNEFKRKTKKSKSLDSNSNSIYSNSNSNSNSNSQSS